MPRATILNGGIDARLRSCSGLSAFRFWKPAFTRSCSVLTASCPRSVVQLDNAVSELAMTQAATMTPKRERRDILLISLFCSCCLERLAVSRGSRARDFRKNQQEEAQWAIRAADGVRGRVGARVLRATRERRT